MLSQDQPRASPKVSNGDQFVFTTADSASSDEDVLVAAPAAPQLTRAEILAKAPEHVNRSKPSLCTEMLLLSDVSFSSPSCREWI